MQRLTVLWLMSIVALGGCAAAMPGYTPPTPRSEKMKAAAPKGGGFEEDGTYKLTDQEDKLDCKHLTGSITVKILQMRQAGDRQEASTAAKMTATALVPLKGGSKYGFDTNEDYRRDRARLETLNNKLKEKECRSFDIDKELAPGNTATPEPVGDPAQDKKKKG